MSKFLRRAAISPPRTSGARRGSPPRCWARTSGSRGLVGRDAADLRELLLRVVHLVLAQEGEAARVVPDALHEQELVGGRGLLEHLVPPAEAGERVVGDDAEAAEERQLLEHLVAHLGRGLARGVDRELAPAVRGGGEPEEVDVVRVVGHRVEALGPALRDVVLVGGDRGLVGGRGVRVAAHALVDVRGHVHHVPRARHQLQQAVRRGLRLLRRVRLHGVDVEVVRPGVVRVAGEHLLQVADDLGRLRVGPAVAQPVVPGPHVHERLRVDRGRVQVVGELLHDLAHRVRERSVGRGAVLRVARVPLGDRVDVRLLAGRGLPLQRRRPSSPPRGPWALPRGPWGR